MKRLAFAAAAVFALVGQPARADEAAANFVKLFNDVCIAKFGHLTAVWDWADSRNLAPITSSSACGLCGQAEQRRQADLVRRRRRAGFRQAWAVPDPAGRFVLATRLDPELRCVGAKARPGRGRRSL